MSTHIEYNPFGNRAIILKFRCIKCNRIIETDSLSTPSPDFSADSSRDSYNDFHEYFDCPYCSENYNIGIWASYSGGYVDISELNDEDEVEVEEIPEPYDDYYKEKFELIFDIERFYENFKSDIESLEKLNEIEIEDDTLSQKLRRQIFIGVITAIETYLSDAFINIVLNDTELLRNFVETYPDFSKRRFDLKDIYSIYDEIEDTAKSVMLDIIYHDLPKVKNMYEATFSIQFPAIGVLMTEILIRHHLVHRGGKTKEGEVITITKKDIERISELSKNFIFEIAKEIDDKGYTPDIEF